MADQEIVEAEPKSRADVSFFALRLRWWGLVAAGGGVCLASTLFAFLAPFAWFFELFAHFHVQYFLALAICSAAGRKRSRRLAFAFAAGALVNLAVIVPLYFGPTVDRSQKTIRLVHANVNEQHGDPERVAAMIDRLKPDIVVLQEVSNRWVAALESLEATYPFIHDQSQGGNFGILLYSKLPLESVEVEYFGGRTAPSLIARVRGEEGLFTLISTHPFPPAGAYQSSTRNAQLEGAAQAAARVERPLLLVGDLNCTPWSPNFRQLLRDGNLRDSTRGRGVQPTWPAWAPPLLIPIDHCLYSGDVQIIHRRLGPHTGSDHLPLVIDFALAPLE